MIAALAGVVLAMASADDAGAIRAARDRYNAAIAAHDVAGVRAAFSDDYTGIAGSGGEVIAGARAMTDYFARAFRQPGFGGFVRTPEVVTVADDRKRAMERGRWTGRVTGAAGVTLLRGEYLAVWVPAADGWRLRSESFVTLASVGAE